MITFTMSSKPILIKLTELLFIIEVIDKELSDVIGEHMVKEMKRTIDEDTEKWPELALRTIELKGHSKKLIDTGSMYNSIEYRNMRDYVSIGIHADAPNDRARIALIHEHGDHTRGVPARPFLKPTLDREIGNIMVIIAKFLGDMI